MNDKTPSTQAIEKTETEWREELTPEQYHVCREKGTERPFTGRYHASKEDGVYRCSCCGAALFDGGQKFDSGTGWPSFWQPALPDAVGTEEDSSYGTVRTEVHCNRCGAHLGHVFPDGPRPTGLRYCINSVSLELEPRGHDKERG
jgi:peptide-methionine (R)-S-oxide reductase